jgi:hypothetical protein
MQYAFRIHSWMLDGKGQVYLPSFLGRTSGLLGSKRFAVGSSKFLSQLFW